MLTPEWVDEQWELYNASFNFPQRRIDFLADAAYEKGQLYLIAQYKEDNPSTYAKYKAYWDNLEGYIKESE